MRTETAAVAVAIAATSCGPSEQPPAPVAPVEPEIAYTTVTIGLAEGPEEYLFGEIAAVAADPEGRIYVADHLGSVVRVYDESGQFVADIGRSGQGPGEFIGPYDITFGPDQRMYVRDAQRISVFAQGSETELWDQFVEVWPHRMLPLNDVRRGVVDSASRYYDPNYYYPNYRRREAPRYTYGIYSVNTQQYDSMMVPPYHNIGATRRAFYMVGEMGGRIAQGLNHAPFEPVPSWAATPRGTIVGGDGRHFVLVETDVAGDTVRVIQGVRQRRAVPSGALRDSARALDQRIRLLPVPLGDVINTSALVRNRQLPDSLPGFIGVYVAADDRIWVEQWPPENGVQLFDVLMPNGELARSVQLSISLDRQPPPYFSRDAIYGVVHDSATGVQRVVRLDIRR